MPLTSHVSGVGERLLSRGLVLQGGLVRRSADALADDFVAAVPRIVSGLVFLVLAAVVVRVVLFVLDRVLDRTIRPEAVVYQQFVRTVVTVFLWFAVALAFLSVVGLDGIAASLGTAVGFVALGVSYALSNMIADAVAGVYLIRDPDFEIGDEVVAGDVTGTVKAVELRKTRLAVGDDTVVRANADIEKKWTKLNDPD